MDDDLNRVGGHCPRCGTEYRPGFAECADCHVPLLPGPTPAQGPVKQPAGEDQPAPVGDLAVVGSWPWQESWLLAGRLRSDGIDARVEPDDYSGAYGTLLHRSFDIVVPRDRLEEARRIAARYATA
jgi:hypothetical protein